MKVLHVSYSDLNGGAARAAYRLHKAQRKSGIQSYMLVIDKFSDDENVIQVKKLTRFRVKISGLLSRKLFKMQKTSNTVQHSLNIFSNGVLSHIKRLNPDVVNLHWVGLDMLSYKEISKIKCPVIWTLHDMWAFCGAEHYINNDNCQRYIIGYNSSTRSKIDKGIDINKLAYSIKTKKLSNKKISFVSPSFWMNECLSQSLLFSQNENHIIQNCVDHLIFKSASKEFSKELLQLDLNKKYILFGAMSSTSDPRKGYKYLVDALSTETLKSIQNNVEILVFGASKGNIEELTGFKASYLGTLKDDQSLVLAYNAADLFVAPSLQDNLPNTIVESLACGTPVVAFNIGGMSDLILDKSNGQLTNKVSSNELANSIFNVIHSNFDNEKLSQMSKLQRSEDIIAKSYFNLYQSLISRSKV